MSTFHTINPATEETIAEYTDYTIQKINAIIDQTHDAWLEWKDTSFPVRSEKFHTLSRLLKDKKRKLGTRITTEMGKPLQKSIDEIEKCAWVCEYFADNADRFLAEEQVATNAQKSYIRHEPLGIVLAIMPWNFPYWQVFRFAAPALMAGNAGLLKHSSNTTGCALDIASLFEEAGFPPHLFATILVDKADTEAVIANDKVVAVTLTGSARAGKTIASLAGKHLKKTVMELGGSDPYLILDGADLEAAAEACVAGRLINTGQSCIAAKRFIVTKKNEQAFTDLFLAKLKEKKTGDPMAEDTHLGPMARKDLRDQLHQQVAASVAKGAKCLTGGKIPDGKGYFYPPTLLTNVSRGMEVYDEEVFGPVAAIIAVENESELIKVANDTIYGLGSAIFSDSIARAEAISKEIKAGVCFINDFVRSDPRLPFGGVKSSGYGRELSSYGIREFVNTKSIYIK